MAQAPLKKKPNYKKTYGASHTSRKNKPERSSSSSQAGKLSKLSRLIRDKKKVVGIAKIEESLSGVARSHMEEIQLLGGTSTKQIDSKKAGTTSSSSTGLIPSIGKGCA